MSVITATFRRELTLAYRRRAQLLNPIYFFVLVVSLFPLGISTEASKLSEIAAGILSVCALLAALLSLDLLFRSDYQDGSLEQMLIANASSQMIVLCKIVSHWLLTGVPLALVSPLLAMMLALPGDTIGLLVLTLLLSTFALSLIGSIGAALTVALGNGGLLLAILILPLLVPVLIFATTTLQAASLNLPWNGYLAFLAAYTAAAFAIVPWLVVAALKITLSDSA
ncbi:heme exporter protein CcmB [Reinekea thalattae]|uniref:Heme exporter protein B n=1 Tax=Reinekea thalattae TaxID=2593301 RepID=A0A5C8Z9A4_9GAMM|nr:heme exporter protein CcmB [Reinekea thalattae]TXR53731.1 heme exporter protein CcmB [Reinekea thalattae]